MQHFLFISFSMFYQIGNFNYYFDQHPNYPKDSPRYGYGSSHGQEVAYVFNYLDASNPQTTKSDIKISDAMSTYWTNFAELLNVLDYFKWCRSPEGAIFSK